MICPYCSKEAEWVDNATVYGKRYGKSYMMWVCRPCDASVGCHNNTQAPLGTLANKALRLKRAETHAILDPLWKSGKFRRGQVYTHLKAHFGHQIHVGESDMEKCDLIIKAIHKIYGAPNAKV